MKVLIISGLCAVAIWSSACFATEKAVSDRNDDLAPNVAPSPSVTAAPLSIARFREQPDVLERLNRIFHTNEQAARIAGTKALGIDKKYASEFVACDDGLSWRVVDTNKLLEVRLDKDALLKPKVTTLTTPPADRSSLPSPMSKDEAIALAGQYFVMDSSQRFNESPDIIDRYFPSVCDLGAYWRILFISWDYQIILRPADIAHLPNGSAPKYLVDKKTGDIIETYDTP